MKFELFKVPENIAVLVKANHMSSTVKGIFQSLGLPEADAKLCAEVLIYADLRGIDTHGVSNMMQAYVNWLKSGEINPTPDWKVLCETSATATIDGDAGLGLAIGPQAMQLAIKKAQDCGIGCVAVTNSRHFGAAAYHAALALNQDMIGVAMTVGGVGVVPTFGAKAMLGLNPIGIAAPTREEVPFIFDASMSSVAGNKIGIAQRLKQKLLGGWIAKPDGTPIMEECSIPDEFLILPLGGTREIGSHKGYGLLVMVDILCGVLSGSGPAFQQRAGTSHNFLAYRIDAFTNVDTFKDDMDVYMKGLRESPTAPGHDRVLYAGLLESETEVERRKRGIPYHPEVVEYLRKTATDLGVAHRLG